MKVRFNRALPAAAALAAVGSANAALPVGMSDVASTIIADIGLASALGASVLVVALGASIAFDIAKKFIKKGAK